MADETTEVRIARLEEGAKGRDRRIDAVERRQDAAEARLDAALTDFRAEMRSQKIELSGHLDRVEEHLTRQDGVLDRLWQAFGERRTNWRILAITAAVTVISAVIAGVATGWRF